MKKALCRANKMHRCTDCLELDCLDGFLPEDRETIRQAISKLPAGKFKMSEVLAQFKIGRRVCAWCKPQRVIGKKLGIEGDTHTMCENCLKTFESDQSN